MPRENVSAFNFTSGEVSPYIAGRVDTKIYANGVRTCENFIVRPQGGVSRRNGTRMVKASWDADHTSLMVPFAFSDVQSYVLQFGSTTATPPAYITFAATASSGGPNLIQVTSVAHGLLTGDRIVISQVTGAGAASTNGTWTIVKTTADVFTLVGSAWAATGAGKAVKSVDGFIHFIKNGEPLMETTTTEIENLAFTNNAGLMQLGANSVPTELPQWPNPTRTVILSQSPTNEVRVTLSEPHTLRTGNKVLAASTDIASINGVAFAVTYVGRYQFDLQGSTFSAPSTTPAVGTHFYSNGVLAGDKFYITATGGTLLSTLGEKWFVVSSVESYNLFTIANVSYAAGTLTGEEAWTIPIEVVHPYAASELGELEFSQSADILYIMHPDHPTMKLTRLDNDGDRNDWLLSEVDFVDGPYLPQNDNAPNVDTTTPANGSRLLDVYLEVSGYSHTATACSFPTVSKSIASTASNGGPNLIRVTSVAHGYSTNNWVKISGFVGAGAASTNGYWKITKIGADTYDLVGSAWVATGTGISVLVFADTVDDASTGLFLEYRQGDQWRLAQVVSGGVNPLAPDCATVNIIDNVLLYTDEATRFKNTPKKGSAPAGSSTNSAWTPVYGTRRDGSFGVVRYQKLDHNNQITSAQADATAGVLTSAFDNTFGVSDVCKYVRYHNTHASATAPDALWAKIIRVDNTGDKATHDAAVTMVAVNSTGNFVITNEVRSGTVKSYRAGVAYALFNLVEDVGRHIRLSWGGKWTWGKILSVVSTSEVTVQFYADIPRDPHDSCKLAGSLDGTAAVESSTGRTYVWRLGAWSYATGFPSTACFHEQRLVFARTDTQPATFWGSITGDFESMSPTELDGTVLDDSGIDFTLASGRVNAIKWLESGTTLVIGTNGGEWVVGATSVTQEPITPTNISVRQQSRNGSSRYAKPMRIGSSIVFVDRSESNVMEVTYLFLEDRLEDKDLTIASEHIIRQGGTVVQTAFQQNPHCIGWFLLSDGSLSAVTYNDDQEIIAWHRHELAGTGAFIESICCVPSEDGTSDDLYLFVKRTINGTTKRYIEMMEPEFYAPASSHTSATIVSTAASGTLIRVATSAAHGFLSGATVTISGANASTNGTWIITAIDSTHFDLIGSTWIATTTGTAAFVSESRYGMQFMDCGRTINDFSGTVITGLTYLTGETLTVTGNGTVITPSSFTAGVLTLAQAYAEVVVGLAYTSTLKSLPIEGGSAFGVSVGMKKQIKEMKARIADSFGLNAGYSASALVSYDYTTRNDSETTLPFFSGTVPIVPKHPNREDNTWLITYALPYPLNILCVVSVIETTQ